MFTKCSRTMALAVAAVTVGLMLAEAGLAGKPTKPHDTPRVISFVETKLGKWWSGDEVTYIKTVDENGGNEFTVTSGPDILGVTARWSPDGLRIGGYKRWNRGATSGNDSGYHQSLMSICADGTDEQVVVSYQEVDAFNVLSGLPSAADSESEWELQGAAFGYADWSPDGCYMVFSARAFHIPAWPHGGNSFRLLYVVDLSKEPYEQGHLRLLTSPEGLTFSQGGDYYPFWSWSLNKIMFSSVRGRNDGNMDLWVINPDRTGLRKLMDYDDYVGVYGGFYSAKAWSRSGDVQDPDDPNDGASLLCLSSVTEGPLLVNVDLSQPDPVRAVTTLNTGGLPGNFSPDDTRLVVEDAGIVVLDLLTGDEQVIVQQVGNSTVGCPDWKPASPSP
jgi:hypothetical protein